MIYSYKDNKCRMGFGVMRLAQNDDGSFPEKTRELLHKAFISGVRYFDTGYEYLKSKSEMLIREELISNYSRDELIIADKLPVWRTSNFDDFERILDEQLTRLGVSYIDFYLLHALNSVYWPKVREADVIAFLERKKSEGVIKNIGFSFHDNVDTLNTILNDYEWDFCQLQLNYYDWLMQGGQENYNLCNKKGIPVSVMEPLGGGRLVNIPDKARDIASNSGFSPAALALNYVSNLPRVFMILSGATNENQLNENLNAIKSDLCVDDDIYHKITDIIREKCVIQCTGCGYCLKECPRNVNIPLCFQKYNDSKLLGLPGQYKSLGEFYFDCIPDSNQASNCIKCGKCRKRCPQKIDIPNELERIHQKAEEELLGITKDQLYKIAENKLLVCFGAGAKGFKVSEILNKYDIKLSFFSDNAERFWGNIINGIPVISPSQISEKKEDYAILIASNYYEEIKNQLLSLGINVIN